MQMNTVEVGACGAGSGVRGLEGSTGGQEQIGIGSSGGVSNSKTGRILRQETALVQGAPGTLGLPS
jgi:hypothetical protein